MKKLFLAAGMMSLFTAANAVTVTVDGVGGGATTFAKLSQAVAYVNANSSEPNVINVTANHTDDTQIVISVPVTINGDPGLTGTPAAIAVARAIITPAADVGRTGRSYIEVETAGNVVVNDLRIYCIDANYISSVLIDGISLYKPASGVGEYVFNKLEIGGSNSAGAYISPTVNDPYTGNRFWYALGNSHGTVHVSNTGGAGSYNSTFNSCHMSMARSHVVYISNVSGTTKINGGLISGAGEDLVRVNGGTGVSIVGTASNRVRFSAANASSAGNQLRLMGSGVIDKLAFADFVNQAARGDMVPAIPTGSAIRVENGTITELSRVRTGNIHAYGLYLQAGTVNVNHSTFHANGTPNFNSTSQPSPNPVRIEGGTATFTDTIFSSSRTGQVLVNGGTVSFANSALPTDAVAAESLNATTPFTGSPSNTAAISVSPTYTSLAYTISGTSNPDFLLPTNSAYATASSNGGYLYGGAGTIPANVRDWNLY